MLFFFSSSLYGGEDFPDAMEFSGSAERWYRVELLIYKQKPVEAAVKEVWPHDLTLSYPDTWVKLKTQEEYIANPHPQSQLASWLSSIKTSPYTPFVLQNDAAKSFAKSTKQIQRSEGDILFHGVWWQPFIQNDSRDPPAILIKAGKQYGNHAELEGSISFKLSRYIHISTNLWLSEFAANVTDPASPVEPLSSPWPALPSSPDQAEAPLVDSAAPESYVPSRVILIKQSRRMRSEETHYIDHPNIGIVVRLTPQPEKK